MRGQQLFSSHFCLPVKHPHKVSVFGRGIVVLDAQKCEEEVSKVTQLDVSHNCISRIGDLSNFKGLESIKMTHNKISDQAEMLKLKVLSRLKQLSVKGNPVLKKLPNCPQLTIFLLGLQVDFPVVRAEGQQMLERAIRAESERVLYEVHLRRLQMHCQLSNQYQVTPPGDRNPSFPKIKPVLHQRIALLNIRKQIVSSIPQETLRNQEQLEELLRQLLESIEKKRSSLVKQIYQQGEILDQIRLQPRKNRKTMVRATTLLQSQQPRQSPPRTQPHRIMRPTHYGKENTKKVSQTSFKQNSQSHFQIDPTVLKDQEKFDAYFMSNLLKKNPLFHLLHSPTHSLESHQKDLLITNLTQMLKQQTQMSLTLQNASSQLTDTEEENNSLKKHLEHMTKQVSQAEHKSNEEKQRLKSLYEEEANRTEELYEQVNQLTTVNLRLIEQQQTNQTIYEQQIKEERIRDNLERNIKNSYLQHINKKAHLLAVLRQSQELNELKACKQLKQVTFTALKQQRSLRYSYRVTSSSLRKKNFKQLVRNMKKNHQIVSSSKAFSRLIKIKQLRALLSILHSHIDLRLKEEQLEKQACQHRHSILKREAFETLSNFYESCKDFQQQENIQQCRNYLIVRKYFRAWGRFISEHQQKTFTLHNNTQHSIKTQALRTFVSHSTKQVRYQYLKQEVYGFVPSYKMINAFRMFCKTTRATKLSRTLKILRITRQKQRQYICFFLSTMSDHRLNQKILKQREEKQRKREEKEQQKADRYRKQAKTSRMLRQRGTLRRIYNMATIIHLRRDSQAISLCKDKEKLKKLEFISLMRTGHLSNLKLDNKVKNLSYSWLFISKVKVFFTKLSLNRRKMTRHITRGQQRLKTRCFYYWKISMVKQCMWQYRQKFHELSPEIDRVSILQRQMATERQLLVEELNRKEGMIQQYLKQLDDYEYALDAKQVKYDRLKSIYEEAMQSSGRELEHTVKRQKHSNSVFDRHEMREPPSDFYVKYLPKELQSHNRQQPTQHEHEDDLPTHQRPKSSLQSAFSFGDYGRDFSHSGSGFLKEFRRF